MRTGAAVGLAAVLLLQGVARGQEPSTLRVDEDADAGVAQGRAQVLEGALDRLGRRWGITLGGDVRARALRSIQGCARGETVVPTKSEGYTYTCRLDMDEVERDVSDALHVDMILGRKSVAVLVKPGLLAGTPDASKMLESELRLGAASYLTHRRFRVAAETDADLGNALGTLAGGGNPQQVAMACHARWLLELGAQIHVDKNDVATCEVSGELVDADTNEVLATIQFQSDPALKRESDAESTVSCHAAQLATATRDADLAGYAGAVGAHAARLCAKQLLDRALSSAVTVILEGFDADELDALRACVRGLEGVDPSNIFEDSSGAPHRVSIGVNTSANLDDFASALENAIRGTARPAPRVTSVDAATRTVTVEPGKGR